MSDIFEKIINSNKYKSILCLNGSLPEKVFFDHFDIPIIAADGAANKLMQMNIEPNIVIGDLDSIKPEYLKSLNHIKILNQNKSDFEKSIEYIIKNKMSPTVILGLGGGYLDHILHNINLFTQTEFAAFSDSTIIFNIRNSLDLKLEKNTKISLFGIPRAQISTFGLKWNLSNELLTFPGKNSAFNRVLEEDIKISVYHGSLLCIVYLEEVIDAGVGVNII